MQGVGAGRIEIGFEGRKVPPSGVCNTSVFIAIFVHFSVKAIHKLFASILNSLMFCIYCFRRLFGFVARKQAGVCSPKDNSCHLFGEIDPEQPAEAVVN